MMQSCRLPILRPFRCSRLQGPQSRRDVPLHSLLFPSSSSLPLLLPFPSSSLYLPLYNRNRIFVLGPSHHAYMTQCGLSLLSSYETPIGNLIVDRGTTEELYKTGHFQYLDKDVEEAEHSLEMHLPYLSTFLFFYYIILHYLLLFLHYF